MLTMADKGGRRGLDPPFLADIICEQPLTVLTKAKVVLNLRLEGGINNFLLVRHNLMFL